MSLICFSLGILEQWHGCHFCLMTLLISQARVLSAQLDSKLVEDTVFLSCYPGGTNSARRALGPHPISSH